MADNLRPIIVKRVKKSAAGHHGGAWKVAYADFVTAMMAFFLLLWLLNAVTEEQRKGIADYFRPTLATDSVRTGPITVMQGDPSILQNDSDTDATDEDEAPPSETEATEKPAETKEAKDTKDLKDAKGVELAKKGEKGETEKIDAAKAKEALEKAEEESFKKAEAQIRMMLQSSPDLKGLAENIVIDRTDEGLRIQLIDREKVSMFPSGSAAMNENSKALLRSVAKVISALPNKLAISGHTDAAGFASGPAGYTNWELSSDRANASRRVLVETGIDSSRIEAIRGKADTDPLIKDDPMSPQNRRISIVLLHGDGIKEKPSETVPKEVAPLPETP